MKSLFIMLVSLLMPSISLSAEEVTRLSIDLIDGKTHHIELPEKPTMTFDGDDMLVKSTNFDLRMPRTDVVKFYFTKATVTSAEGPEAATAYLVRYSGNVLTLTGSDVLGADVHRLDGRLLLSAGSEGGHVRIDMNAYPKGVYVVSPKNHPAFKVTVR